jgi:RNA-binding protein 16
VAKKSEYKSNKSVAKNPTVPISVDDPRLAWNKAQQTKSRQGAEVDMVGIDGKSLIQGGNNLSTPNGGTRSDNNRNTELIVIPPSRNNPGYAREGYFSILPTEITNLETAWSGNNLVITFDWDYEDPENDTVSDFVVELTGEGETVLIPYGTFTPNRTQTQQTLTVTEKINEAAFNIWTVNLSSVCVYAMDAFYNKSESVCDTSIPEYPFDLPAPVITVSAIMNGYKVAYTTPTQGIYDAIEISEYESENNPGNVSYNVVFWDQTNPAIIVAQNSNKRWVKARFSSKARIYTAYSEPVAVTPINPVTVDDQGPPDVVSVTTTGGIDATGVVGFNGFANISWPAISSDGIRGYRIRYRPVTTPASSYSYADSPGTAAVGTTLSYRLGSLALGTTYEIAVATYDEFNNTSTNYISGSNVSISGTPYIANTVDVTGFFKAKANPSDLDSTAFKFGYGVETGKRGLVFDSSNYWYIDSDQSSSLKVGDVSENYLEWNGTKLIIDGDIQAKGGYFAGNVEMQSGGSLYSGTYGASSNNNGFILNNAGLRFDNGTTQGITQITALDGQLTTTKALIGGWTINSSSITKTTGGQGTIDINSTQGYIGITAASLSGYYAGVNAATANIDSVFWAGTGKTGEGANAVANPNSESNAFRVTLAGSLYASDAFIEGNIRALNGGFGTFNTDGTIKSGWKIDGTTLQAINYDINNPDKTQRGYGSIKMGNYLMQSVNGTDFGIYDISPEAVSKSDTIIRTETVPQATDPRRIYIGDLARQVEVARSAQISSDATSVELDSFLPNNSTVINAYRSGGLRNMFTAKLGALTAATNPDTGTISLYPSAIKGDMLVVYEVNNPNNDDDNPWRKVHSVYLNTKGVSGVTYYYAGYSIYNGVCLSAPGADGTTFSTQNLPSGITIQSGTTLTQVFATNSSSGEIVWGVYSSDSFEEAIDALNAHATAAGNACAPGKFKLPDFVGKAQPPSTDQYTIVLGPNVITNSPSLFGIVAEQDPEADTLQDEGVIVTINMYTSSTQFKVPNFVGKGQPPSTQNYNIIIGPSTPTSTSSLAGTVATQDIPADSMQDIGIDITVSIFVLEQTFVVEDFVGKAQPPSTSEYTIALGPSTPTTTPSLAGTVATQDKAAGSTQLVGTTITISMYVLETPPPPTTFVVEDFVGKAQPPSTSEYTIALGPNTFTNTPSLAGTVATQDKAAGSTQPIGTTITISMYVLQPTFVVPNFVGGAQPPSTSDYTIVLGPDTITSSPALFGTVATQDKAAGSSQPVGTTITISIYVAAPPPFFPPYFPFFPPYFPFFPPYFPFFSPTNPPPFFPPYFPFFSPTNPPPFFPPYFPSFSISDERDKINIEPLSIGIDFVNDLSPFTYTWNMRDESCVGVEDFGFIAQDLAALEDSVDGHERLRLTNRENPDKLMISQDRLIPILVKAIQDLSNQIEDLKKD